ncbi:NDR1/HIN1-like protein 26 [Cocos nucifera]|uniref:NDR1/HIN1-like protein 26 n=1 Tax=Cocos nucifera TaxID=13894 RepID=A0A8K0N527_COCNU|nr:NDR1/HIN1-like protein 26 [Cocos nucifera]
MSLYLTSSPKDCSKKGFHINKLSKKLLYTLSTLLLSIVSAAFLIWLILHPSKPEFSLRDTSLYELSLSSPHLLNSTIQTTIVSKNPNNRVGIYYDQLRVYAAYKGQQITADSLLPPFYQGHQDSNLLSASLHGTGMPVAPSFGYEVGRDQTAGRLYLGLRLDGQLRWKVGTWVSGRYRFDVDCMAVIAIRPGDTSGLLGSVQGNQCSTTV